MSLVESVRRRWRRFMGRESQPSRMEDLHTELEAELDFHQALMHLKKQRGEFDTRPPPPIQSEPPDLSLDELRDRLGHEDRLVREALDDDED